VSVRPDDEVAFLLARLGGTCGNGVIDAPEQCDDGNTGALDCCTPGCALVPSGGTCEFDGNVCTSDTCDGAGTCSLGGPAVRLSRGVGAAEGEARHHRPRRSDARQARVQMDEGPRTGFS
jgi:cysteine-rich repeat protein